MDHVQVRIQASSTVQRVLVAKTVLVPLRDVRQKVDGGQPIQLLESREAERILSLGVQRCRAQVRPHAKVGDSAEQHHRLDKQYERVGVLRGVLRKHIQRRQILRVVRHDLLPEARPL